MNDDLYFSEGMSVIPQFNKNKSNVEKQADKSDSVKNNQKSTTSSAKKIKESQCVKVDSGDSIHVSSVRNMPTVVLNQIKAEFPMAKSYADALMAYIVYHGEGEVLKLAKASLTEAQMELVRAGSNSSYDDIKKKLDKLGKTADSIKHNTELIELLVSYMTFDRLGFRRGNPISPRDVDLREDGVVDLLLQAENQNQGFQIEKNQITGRPIR